jgi:hypothetical protein
MADELEPYVPEIQPTAVYGPDDWRPFPGGYRASIQHGSLSGLERSLAAYRAQAKADYAAARQSRGTYLGIALNDAAIGERVHILMDGE